MHTIETQFGPPARGLATEIIIGALIFVGSLAASMLTTLVLAWGISAVGAIFIPGNDEGAVFAVGMLYASVYICVGLLVNPVMFASIGTNHCRRVTPYFAVLTPMVWLLQLSFLRQQQLLLRGGLFAALASAGGGMALAYWIIQRKAQLNVAPRPLATNH